MKISFSNLKRLSISGSKRSSSSRSLNSSANQQQQPRHSSSRRSVHNSSSSLGSHRQQTSLQVNRGLGSSAMNYNEERNSPRHEDNDLRPSPERPLRPSRLVSERSVCIRGSYSKSEPTWRHVIGSHKVKNFYVCQERVVLCGSNDTLVVSSARKRQTKSAGVLGWLMDQAPTDLLPEVFAFLGARRMATLSLTCKQWHEVCTAEPVWRTLSEEMFKWKAGDAVPDSWLQFYKDNPLVPVDYDTIHSALVAAGSKQNHREQKQSVRILLRPGRYATRDTILVHTLGDAEVTIESVDMPQRSFQTTAVRHSPPAEDSCSVSVTPSRSSRHLTRRISSLLTRCRSGSASDEAAQEIFTLSRSSSSPALVGDAQETPSPSLTPRVAPPDRATLVLRTRRQNKPVIRVRQGKLNLVKVNLVHSSHGTDIWNGNAAVQVQPHVDEDGEPVQPISPSLPPTANVENSDIMSVSGRGVVAIDGGRAELDKCHIHNCAATGIYVGGPGSTATIERTDVIRNGNGNDFHQRGIARGHSGIYLEQGVATVRDCNVSNNSLTGLSAISSDNATLHVEDSDLVSNGSLNLEMPPDGSTSWRRSVSRNNTLSRHGVGRCRSGLMREGVQSQAMVDRDQSIAESEAPGSIASVGANLGALIRRR